MKLPLEEYKEKFQLTDEALKAKLQTQELESVQEDGILYIIEKTKQKTTVAMVFALYQKENQELKDKINFLEKKIDALIYDKEQMLRDEINKIESVYGTKDEQLKNILELINKQLSQQKTQLIHDVQTIDTPQENSNLVELKKYLKSINLKDYQKKIIKKRFRAAYGKDVRVLLKDGNFYLDYSKYDYTDLLEF